MTEEQARLKERFLEPETRDGYFISAEMKAAWKEMLDITEEIVRICDKHGLNYTLAGGTLLGAVRHKGFIPWDDDIDLDMPRADYDKLIKILPRELRAPYVMQTPVTDPGRTSRYLQVRNPRTTGIYDYWAAVEKGRFNMGIGVDVFPIDGVPDTRFAWFRTKALHLVTQWTLNWSAVQVFASWRDYVKKAAAKVLCLVPGRWFIWKVREWTFAANRMDKCRLCGEFSFQMFSDRTRWAPRCYDSCLSVPFEYLDLKIPVGYDEVLTAKYGDWRKPSKSGGYHDSQLIFDLHRSYKEILVERFGYKKEWVENLP